jgi:uncharacterized membrane protein
MKSVFEDSTGLVHLIASIIAMISGMWVLVSTKGTLTHKRIGYIYAFSMLILNITAFMIYRLYGKFGVFHWFAVVSSLTLIAGLYPVIAKKTKNYLLTHFRFMYWSVIGLYCAFVAEVFSRLPKLVLTESGEPMTVFYKLVGIGTLLVMIVGTYFYVKFKPKWTLQYKKNR